MNTKKLKRLVLDLAIHGKLVPQDPNDEPASELLKRIVETHGRASNIGRASNKKSAISSEEIDEVPFEVPKGWVWTNLKSICCKLVDGDHNPPVGEKEPTKYLMASSKNINNDKLVDLDDVRFLSENCFRECDKRTKVSIGDIAITSVGTLGRTCIIKEKINLTFQRSVTVLSLIFVDNRYVKYVLDSSYIQKFMLENSRGTAQQGFYINQMEELLIPLPPLSEQRRIVLEIEKWFGIIDQIESNETDLRKSIEQTKKKVLDLAIHGKLVPQDPNDEPASELLKRIVETHGRASNISKGKKSAISSEEIDEVPFEVPKGWVWTNLKSICCKLVDGDHNPPVGEKEPTKYLMASSKNINNDKLVDLDDVRFLSENCFRECDKRTKVSIGDIAITSVGTLGRTCIIKEKINLTFQRSVTVLSLIFVDNRYVKYVLDSSYIQKFMLENSRGTAQQGFYINQMEELLIPLPPLSEQKRIVAKIEEVFGELDRMLEMIG